ncbi:Ppx/GppA family phosphatase [Marinilactibacillus kalidii]|uniref:Ppx/GppA family phosphatase n=1 Tax=Marinilactibacillus kalidii TaxID=2820274 RepID=UPI001ABDC847|nr:Ppx/GppA family phosphatase [Marinilactibacillus kalidii]
MVNQRIGLIDVGSNTIRLVIFEIDQNQTITELQNIKTPARLVQYLDTDSTMSKKGIDVLVAALESFTEIAERYHIETMIPVATAAIRRSKNAKAILKTVKSKTDLALRILNEEEEAFYGNYAVRHTMDIRDGVTIDIGGGSTELTLFKDKQVVDSHSFPFGVVSLKKDFFEGKDHNDKKAIEKARKWVKEQFTTLDWLPDVNVPLIGIGGSARNLADVHQRQHDYPIAGIHGYTMSGNELEETFDLIADTSLKQLSKLDGLNEDRKDIIIPAGLVFLELFDFMDSTEFAISSRGLREGLVIDYINRTDNQPYELYDIKRQTVERMAKRYHVRAIGAYQRILLSDRLLNLLKDKEIISVDEAHLILVHYAASLYYLGSYIEDDSKSQHTFYIISNSNLHGFNHQDRVRLALLASYKNKSLFHQYIKTVDDWFSEEEKETLLHLGSIIKFAEALNDSHVNLVKDIQLFKNKDKNIEDKYELTVTYNGDVVTEKYRANKHKNHLERVLGDTVHITFKSESDQ